MTLHDLSDEQIWKIWLMYDRVYDHKGYDPCPPVEIVTTHAHAFSIVDSIFSNIDAATLEFFEDELERDEEFRLANWMRKFRHELESVDEERARYARDDEEFERLTEQRRRRRPRG